MGTALAKTQPPAAKKAVEKRPAARKKERSFKVGMLRCEKILRFARRRTGVTMDDLKTELEMSRASVNRDIELLRSMGCPIEWDPDRKRYFVRDLPGGKRFELPGLWFDASEVFALLMMIHLVEGMEPGFLMEHLTPMKERLRDLLAEGGKSAAGIETKVKLIHFAPRKVQPKHFQVVAAALLDGKQVELHYLRRDKKEHTKRVISPLQLVHYRGNWVMDAWCHMRDDLRSFALDAIEAVVVLDAPAKKVSREDMRAHFQSGYGIFAGKATHRAILKFTPDQAQYVSLETWHPDQSDSWLADGSYVLEVPYSNDQELVMDLLRFGREVEVLGPPQLRQRVFDSLCAAARIYGQPPPS